MSAKEFIFPNTHSPQIFWFWPTSEHKVLYAVYICRTVYGRITLNTAYSTSMDNSIWFVVPTISPSNTRATTFSTYLDVLEGWQAAGIPASCPENLRSGRLCCSQFQLNRRTNYDHRASQPSTCLLWFAWRPELIPWCSQSSPNVLHNLVICSRSVWTSWNHEIRQASLAFHIWSSMPYLATVTADLT